MSIPAIQNSGARLFENFDSMRFLEHASSLTSWQQRAILGAAALTIQPMIDRTNTDLDPETRKTAANRTFSKALVGVITGVSLRAGCMQLSKLLLKNDRVANKLASYVEHSAQEIKTTQLKRYSSVVGTIAALGAMVVTNFLVDGPLTLKLTNYLNERDKEKAEANNAPHFDTNNFGGGA